VQTKSLLSIVELGGYPNFKPLYESFGYEVVVIEQMRKALRFLKSNQPDVIVAEFNFQSDFRDRTSNLESMLALVQRYQNTKVIVFYDREFQHQYSKLSQRFHIHQAIPFPVEQDSLSEILGGF